MQKFTNLVCETTKSIDGELYRLQVTIPEIELEFYSEVENDAIKVTGQCKSVEYTVKNKI